MTTTLSPHQNVHLALKLLATARPSGPTPTPPRELPSATKMAQEIAEDSTELSLALAAMIRSGNPAAHAARIKSSLAAQHDIVRRIHRLPRRS